MNIVLLIIIIISFWGCHFRKDEKNDYMNPVQTSAINGIFVMLVFIRHFGQYITIGRYDGYYQMFDSYIGQLIVTTFLFYSGYGIMYSFMNKKNYDKEIPKRILKILFKFDLAIILYLIVDIIIGGVPSFYNILLAFVAWESIGNSNWYIFAIIFLYLISYISGKFFKSKNIFIAIGVTIGACLYIICLFEGGKAIHWYNTILCYPAGMYFAIFRDKFDALVRKSRLNRVFIFVALVVLFVALFYNMLHVEVFFVNLLMYELTAIIFVQSIICFTTIFVINNDMLIWLGKHLFEIYILQRIPMIMLKDYICNKYIFFVLCIAITMVISIEYKRLAHFINTKRLNGENSIV